MNFDLEKALAIEKVMMEKTYARHNRAQVTGCRLITAGYLVLRKSKRIDQRFIAIHSRKVCSVGGPQGYMSFHSRRDLCKPSSYGDDKILKIIEIG